MHQSLVFRRKRTVNSTEVVLLLFWTLLHLTSCEQNTTWFGSKITVTRNQNSLDHFDFWTDKETKSCSMNILANVCENYGGFEATNSNCKEPCCKRCKCRARSTFLAQRQQCVPDSNITQLSGSSQLLFNSPNTRPSCTNNSHVPTLDLTRPNSITFTLCLNGIKTSPAEIKSCSLIPNKHSTVDSWDGSEDLQKYVKNTFTVDKKMELKWNGVTLQSLEGFILSIKVKCVVEIYTMLRPSEVNVESNLFLKVKGSQTVKGPMVFYPITTKPPTQSTTTTTLVTTTTSSTTQYQSKLNVVHVASNAELLLIIVSAGLGSILFVVIMVAVILIVMFRRKQKLNISGKHTSNPTYERGPESFPSNDCQTGSFKYHFYQPLVENTRDASRKEPIYESLDDNLRESKMSLTENPTQRCSLAYCDVTSDGYLIPTDGPIPAPCPRNTGTSPPPEGTTRPRLSSSYDEPEVILKDRKPKLTVEIPVDDSEKLDYQELENEHKQRQQDNETIVDNSKSPTENTYLELIAEEPNHSREPLESDTL